MLTHWKKMDNPDYIGAYAFQPGEEKIVTITGVRRETVVGVEGKKEECTVVHFKEEKPLILNATNGKAISKSTGTPYIEEWAGKCIKLVVKKVKAYGDIVDAVRVSPVKVEPPKVTPIICAECGKVVTGYGKMSPAEVAKATEARFGRKLCFACGEKAATEKKVE